MYSTYTHIHIRVIVFGYILFFLNIHTSTRIYITMQFIKNEENLQQFFFHLGFMPLKLFLFLMYVNMYICNCVYLLFTCIYLLFLFFAGPYIHFYHLEVYFSIWKYIYMCVCWSFFLKFLLFLFNLHVFNLKSLIFMHK